MTNYEYACWVRGFLQLCPDVALNRKKLYILKNHLNLVFAVEKNLGEKNQLVLDKIIELQSKELIEAHYKELKDFLCVTYFEQDLKRA